jgi:uncharacterized RDD family membrane protein YckC
MRCPKCQYISFDSADRCRNCGYDLSFSTDEALIDVAIGRDEPPPGRMDDLSLSALDTPLSSDRTGAAAFGQDPDLVSSGRLQTPSPGDLPLFTDRLALANPDDQAPLVSPPAVPRQPLSVRRAQARPRPRNPLPQELSLDLGDREDAGSTQRGHGAGAFDGAEAEGTAGLIRRGCAGLTDSIILVTINAAVVYLTLRACELTPEQWRLLPLVPLAAFMLMLCGGYFILFTAACGQTIGKMATGIRVVSLSADDSGGLRVSFRAALIRTIACLGSVVALGSGFLPVIVSPDRRAFHDRVAGTRVVLA